MFRPWLTESLAQPKLERISGTIMDTELSPLDRERIADVLGRRSFIEAVKLYRSLTGCDLATAKAAVEQIRANAPSLSQCPRCGSQLTVSGLLGI